MLPPHYTCVAGELCIEMYFCVGRSVSNLYQVIVKLVKQSSIRHSKYDLILTLILHYAYYVKAFQVHSESNYLDMK